jgi:hypothetical protein
VRKTLIKLLSINPLLSLLLVALYIAFLWFVTASIWANNHKVGAVIFVLTMTFFIKLKSKGLIEDLKKFKADKQ